MQKTDEQVCPICASALICNGRKFSLDELLVLWKPVTFSSETIEEHKKQSDYTQLHVCPHCQLEIFLPQIIGTPSFYVELLRHESVYAYSEEKWDFDEALKDARKCGSVVEIGCGPGNFLAKIKPYVCNVVGTEYNEHALAIALSKGLEILSKDDGASERVTGKFDIAFSFHVLEHIPDPVEFVQEMLSWVKPGGKIGISVPNMDGPIRYIDPCVSNMPPHHATRWKLRTFEVLAKGLGLKLERVAFEPLGTKDQYYYSDIGINHLFPGNSWPMKVLRFFGRKGIQMFFKMLTVLGKDSTSLLRGQSIYVLLTKID